MSQFDTFSVVEELKENGFAVRPSLIDAKTCKAMADEMDVLEKRQREQGKLCEAKGSHVVIFSPFFLNPDVFLPWIGHQPFFDVASEVLQHDHIILNGAAGSRSAGVAHSCHKDGALASANFCDTTDLQVGIALDEFSEETGGTHFWKGSHKTGLDPKRVKDVWERPEREIVTGPPGSVIFFLGQTWHAMGSNPSGRRRWGYFLQYTRWFVKPMFEHTIYCKDLYPRLDTRQKQLLGFSTLPPKHPYGRVMTVSDPNALPDDYEAAVNR